MGDNVRSTLLVIIRVDEFQAADDSRFTVKEIVRTESEAEAEVMRLNELNRERGARYLWQVGRLRP